ncbi:NAD(P)H-quinone oxidoreductase [Pseudomonas asiatica]|uniref:NAD(P)H-quinone oxidoreductase n=1 Tax=Pseudomonas monteilii TaxID=76759 RepID=A0A2N1IN45_9PSED|nr:MULTISPECIES: NAD(P)H-quinone oxidoreductase [Pseudomonas]PKI19671.1 NAD(P)H-quinone oxidoreductase [Pseudomonas monteilii]RPD93815.1 NAD(P)H-quinone oxidoreductase [Pseudomonas monteilii]WDM87320.1 NAD(P)H-quinone oxidoreductase [Pseudomonas asiatica]
MSRNMLLIDHRPGGNADCLQVTEVGIPTPAADEVLIRVAYAGVNRPDVLQRSGNYPPPADASPYLGLEVSGEVVAVGAAVQGLQVGAYVCALTPGGGYAEYCCAPAAHCLPVPSGLSLLQAAALPENYFTVWTNLFERGRLLPGETVLVHGGSSGIGLTAIQLANQFGARVLATAGSEAKLEACRSAGASRAINYREEDFVEVVRAETDGKGVNLILDMVGGSYLQRNIDALAVEGRLVQIAFLEGSTAQLNVMPIMLKRLTFTGSTLRARPKAEKANIAAVLQARVWPLLGAGRCLPVIHRTFPLHEASQAHALMESSRHIGKIMLEINP